MNDNADYAAYQRRAKAFAEALVALLSTGISEGDCRKVIEMIDSGKIPHLRVEY